MSYLNDQTDAKALLADAGQPVTLTPSGGTYDPATATVNGSAGAPVSTVGVVFPLSRGLKHMPGSDIQVGDQQLLLPGDIAQPALNTTATIGGLDYVIKEVAQLSPGGTVLLFDCVIRR